MKHRTLEKGRRFRCCMVLAAAMIAAACGGAGGQTADAGTDGGLFNMPEPEDLLDPAVYDCRAEASPPDKTSPVLLNCFYDPQCTDWIVVAHRASSFFAPENTLSAIRSAVALGVDMVELDTRLTADGVVVLMHDDDVDRTTDATGPVDAYTLAELQSLTLSVDPDVPGDYSCERVPTFAEALALCRGRINIMVDIKEGPAEAALEVEAAGMLDQAILLDGQSGLADARSAVPGVRVMIRPHEAAEVTPFFQAFAPPPDVVHIDTGFDEPAVIAEIHGLSAKALIDTWVIDAEAVVLGDVSGYVDNHQAGIQLQQSEFPFFVLQAAGRLEIP